jgi:tripartite-type tricarboxylate transporter receptor subunit TctC
MSLPRRRFLHLVASVAALPVASGIAKAQTVYPSRPVRIIVGFTAGSGADIEARLIGQWLSERLGQSFIIENRTGSGSNIAAQAVVNSPPDGYTLLWITAANASNVTLYQNLRFNFLTDIAPVASFESSPLVMLVNLSVPATTVPEFIAYAKANPGKISMGSTGVGSVTHLAGELFKSMTGVEMLHVPYRGEPHSDLIGGQVQVYFGTITAAVEFIKAGKLRGLAVTTANRSDVLPELPTVGNSIPGYEASVWQGAGVPTGTSPEIIEKLNREINAGLANPSIKAQCAKLGITPMPFTPAEFGAFLAAQTEKWGKVIKAANIKVD